MKKDLVYSRWNKSISTSVNSYTLYLIFSFSSLLLAVSWALDSRCSSPISHHLIPFYSRDSSTLGKQSNANKFTLNKIAISLLILSTNFLAAAKLPCTITFLWHSAVTANRLRFKCALIPSPLERWRSLIFSLSTLCLFIHTSCEYSNNTFLSLFALLQTEEEVSVGGYCQSRFLPDTGARLAPQQGCAICCQDNHRPRGAGKQHHQLPAPQPPMWRAEERLHHR